MNYFYENYLDIEQEQTDDVEAVHWFPESVQDDYKKYENVTVNIWLAKGDHHFI